MLTAWEGCNALILNLAVFESLLALRTRRCYQSAKWFNPFRINYAVKPRSRPTDLSIVSRNALFQVHWWFQDSSGFNVAIGLRDPSQPCNVLTISQSFTSIQTGVVIAFHLRVNAGETHAISLNWQRITRYTPLSTVQTWIGNQLLDYPRPQAL